jgi:flagellar M-ring protein FliF
MPDWRSYLRLARVQAGRIPLLGWAAAGAVVVALGIAFSFEFGDPPYAALYEGLTPAQGGSVIAQLQKLGIPYQLQAAGNIILVPAPDLASARLQLGAAQVPGDDVSDKWNKLETAPMTTSDVAQAAMADQALEASLAQSIESMSGINSAQVYLALPPDTPFLEDQPKPTASVVIAADPQSAQAQGAAIANLVAGAVPGLGADQVSVETTDGVAVYPVSSAGNVQSQFKTVSYVENTATARIAQLLTPLVGAGNFRTDVSANVDFTQEQIKRISYGPAQLVTHSISDQSDRTGAQNPAFGIPGALSNEPPASTAAQTPVTPNGAAADASGASTDTATGAQAPPPPHDTTKSLDQTFVTDQSESDITKPDWTVNAIDVSVVLNKAAMGAVTTDQVKAAIAGAFAYPQVQVSVLAAPFQSGIGVPGSDTLLEAAAPVTRGLLEVVAAAAMLFGLALPFGRYLNALALRERLPAPLRMASPLPAPPMAPRRDLTQLRARVADNPVAVAGLLQSWIDEE